MKEALNMKEQGNSLYKKKCFQKALFFYDTSIRHLHFLTNDYIKCLGNKSAVLYEQQEFRKCAQLLNEIFKLRRLEIDPNLENKLRKRLSHCIRECGNGSEENFHLPDILSLHESNKLELVTNTDNSYKSVRAREDIDTNETLLVFDPFEVSLGSDKWPFYCYYCFTCTRDLFIVPCDSCSYIQYCSTDCRDSDSIHGRLECTNMPVLSKLGIVHFALRIMFKMSNTALQEIHSRDTNKTFSITNDRIHGTTEHEMEVIDVFYEDFVTITEICKSTEFRTAVELVSQQSRFNKVTKDELFVILRVLTAKALMNAVTVQDKDELIGCGLYPQLALLNHSCYSNTISLFSDKRVVLKSVVPIPCFNEVLNCYGVSFQSGSLQQRQESLLETYNFKCACIPCTDGWEEESEWKISCKNCSRRVTLTENMTCCKNPSYNTDNIHRLTEVYSSAVLCFDNGSPQSCLLRLTQNQKLLYGIYKLPDKFLLDWNALAKKCITEIFYDK